MLACKHILWLCYNVLLACIQAYFVTILQCASLYIGGLVMDLV